MSTVWAVGRSSHTHTHRYSQFSAHVVKKNEKKKREQTWHWLELSRNLILIFYKTLLSFFSFASEKRHGVIGKVTCSHDTNHLPPLSRFLSPSLFNQTPWLMHQGPGVTVLLPFRRLSPHLPRVIQLWLVGWRGLGDRMARWQGEWHKMTEGVREREEEGRVGGGWGGRWWWWGGGYTVEQKNYRALIAGTSLETETREWGGFTAPIISSPAPPHRSPARTRDGEEERESEMERERESIQPGRPPRPQSAPMTFPQICCVLSG